MSNMTKKKKELNQIINKRVGENLEKLLQQNQISQTEFPDKLRELEWEYTLDRTAINKLINDPDDSNLSIPFLIECADYFHTTVDFLIADNSKAAYREQNSMEQRMPRKAESSVIAGKESKELLIENPSSVFFKNYLNTYFCYYYSTISDELKEENPIFEGELSLYEEGERCGCTLKVDTKKYRSNGEKFYKTYIGNAVICMASQTIHCSMCDYEIGEYCDLIFRYSQLNSAKQACRMAEVLSTSSGPDKRYPVIHRMFLSIDKIAEEDYELIKSQLCLNNSEIMLSKEKLDSLKDHSEEYASVIKELENIGGKEIYFVTEGMINEIAKKYMPGKEEVFTNDLRKCAKAYRYNKVSKGVDTNLWNILHRAGYYKEITEGQT